MSAKVGDGACHRNAKRRESSRVSGSDYFVSWADAEGTAGEMKGVGAVGHADRIFGAAIIRELSLESGHVLTQMK